METVKLAEEFMLSTDGLVVGLDLSGDPTVSETTIELHATMSIHLSLAKYLCLVSRWATAEIYSLPW